MDAPPRVRNPQSVLFACGFNSVRSPMAESLLQRMFPHALYVKSAGVKKGELDPFAVAVMAELGQDISGHKPITFEELEDWEGLNFDGSREQKLAAYREVCDSLLLRIRKRFSKVGAASG
jgi:hypothetical protein